MTYSKNGYHYKFRIMSDKLCFDRGSCVMKNPRRPWNYHKLAGCGTAGSGSGSSRKAQFGRRPPTDRQKEQFHIKPISRQDTQTKYAVKVLYLDYFCHTVWAIHVQSENSNLYYMLLGWKCVLEERHVGGNIKKPFPHTIFNDTAYALFLGHRFQPLSI